MRIQHVFYVVGVIFIFASILYFAREFIADMADPIKLILLIFATALSFIVAELFRGEQIMVYGFYPVLGVGVFWVGLIVAIILFSIYRKVYPVFYMISVALYIFTVGFMIDVFEFGRLGIMSTLVVSAVLFMALGYYLSKVMHPGLD